MLPCAGGTGTPERAPTGIAVALGPTRSGARPPGTVMPPQVRRHPHCDRTAT
ncbi:hypothetical protein FM110_09725 [Brachybacterium nesterenkovii]|uniref:Uncharacterized protein n=1 Tax=Brachybacterium nesterenkovii TaxID=47847 RepID=A0A1X6X3L6_9MICO|nr:hypothetical protein FM110_09725 [Brachybacterium nesterenkovii]